MSDCLLVLHGIMACAVCVLCVLRMEASVKPCDTTWVSTARDTLELLHAEFQIHFCLVLIQKLLIIVIFFITSTPIYITLHTWWK